MPSQSPVRSQSPVPVPSQSPVWSPVPVPVPVLVLSQSPSQSQSPVRSLSQVQVQVHRLSTATGCGKQPLAGIRLANAVGASRYGIADFTWTRATLTDVSDDAAR